MGTPLGEARDPRLASPNRGLALRIAMVGVDFEVHEPPELVEHLRALAFRLGRAAR